MTLNFKHDVGIKASNNTFGFSIDPTKLKETSEINFVTHAHRDHINLTKKSRENNFITTRVTADVMKHYFGDFNSNIIDYNDKLKIDDITFEFKDSGHVLGSYLLNIYNDQKITVTSDLNTTDGVLTNSVKPEQTDILFIESTFGNPECIFPDREKTFNDLIGWLRLNHVENKLSVIFAYAMGKTQEIVSLINRELDLSIGLVSNAYEITKIHKKHGAKLENFHKVNGNLKDLDVLIVPPSYIKPKTIPVLEYDAKRKLVFANVTGQNFGFGRNFKISSHSDVNGLLDFVEQSNPKKVYTYHGHKEALAKQITKKLNIHAEPLKEVNL